MFPVLSSLVVSQPETAAKPRARKLKTQQPRLRNQRWRRINPSGAECLERLMGTAKGREEHGRKSYGRPQRTAGFRPKEKSLLFPSLSTSARTVATETPEAHPNGDWLGVGARLSPRAEDASSPIRRRAPFLHPHLPRQSSPNAVHCSSQPLIEPSQVQKRERLAFAQQRP